MRVAFIARATLFSSYGGDTKQVEETAENLRLIGVSVDVKLTNEVIDYAQYDLLHFFNIIRPADIIKHVLKSRKPYVVSTIFLDYGLYERQARGGLLGRAMSLFSEDAIEYFKAIARRVKNGERILSRQYLLWGHRRSVLWVARRAAMLLPNSESEYQRFLKKYGRPEPYRVVVNGIDLKAVTREYVKDPKWAGAVLCVARIEGRKNQLNLIRALQDTDYQLFIHGKPSPNNKGYYDQCRAEAGPNVHFSEWLSEDELLMMYHSAKVHVLPSYFETTGSASTEAAVMGCNIVITACGDTRDYFKDYAIYCEPDSQESIRAAIDKAYATPYSEAFRAFILKNYTWQRAAEQSLAAYKEVLKHA